MVERKENQYVRRSSKATRTKAENQTLENPEQLWVSDITYIGTRKEPMYLSLVTDAYSKQIMGYDVSRSLHATGANKALTNAIKKQKIR